MILLKDVIERQKELVNEAIERTNNINRKSELTLMYNSLDYIKENKPKTFHQALQLQIRQSFDAAELDGTRSCVVCHIEPFVPILKVRQS